MKQLITTTITCVARTEHKRGVVLSNTSSRTAKSRVPFTQYTPLEFASGPAIPELRTVIAVCKLETLNECTVLHGDLVVWLVSLIKAQCYSDLYTA